MLAKTSKQERGKQKDKGVYRENADSPTVSKDAKKKKEEANKQNAEPMVFVTPRGKKTLSKRASRLDTATARVRVCVVLCVFWAVASNDVGSSSPSIIMFPGCDD